MSSSLIRQESKLPHRFVEQDFDIEYWSRQGRGNSLAGGRGASFLIEIEGSRYVLRHYLRGGLMASLLRDRYLWTGLERTRPACEWQVVNHALEHDLPVPGIAAIRVQRSGIWYRAAIISCYIENQGTLAARLVLNALDADTWHDLGKTIAAMHRAGIDHADLNANNLLFTEQGKWCLIDFDKAVIRPLEPSWSEKNLNRLQRSLRKIEAAQKASGQPFHFTARGWRALLDGYRR